MSNQTKPDLRKGQWWRDQHGELRVMAVAENYAMVKRKRAAPIIIAVKKFDQLTRLYVAAKDS